MGKQSCWHQKFAGGTPIWASGHPERASCAASASCHPQSASSPEVLKSQQESFLSAMPPKIMKETPLGFNPSQQSPWKGLLAQGPSRRHAQPCIWLRSSSTTFREQHCWFREPVGDTPVHPSGKPEMALDSIPACPSHSLWAVLSVQGPGEWHLYLCLG